MKPTFTQKLVLLVIMIACTVSVSAQYPAGISFKRLFLDYQTLQDGDFGAFKDYRGGFEVGLHLPLSESFMLNVPLKIGLGNKTDEVVNEHIIGLDAQLHYYFLPNPNRFKPYLLAGIGGVFQGKDSINIQVPVGIGVDIQLAPNAYFNIQSEFRWSSAENNNNFNHGIGFKYFFGRKDMDSIPVLTVVNVDTDGDGISNQFDVCPDVAGLVAFAGCPDSDGDGVEDSKDDCVTVAGLIEFKGCPDRDNDGISDNMDACPDSAGPVANNGCPTEVKDSDNDGISDDSDQCPDRSGPLKFNGCPDTDNDGIADPSDKCPNAAGLAVFGGCPDTDKDGIEDAKDKCPNTAGPASNNGCPIIEAKDREVLSFAMKAVQFELGKATLKSESYTVLNQIADIMRKYPDYNLSIEGHTDNTGTAEVNHKLSHSRARACYEYLIQRGIPANRMTHKGYGQTRPIADNSTYSGRTLNRRVEFNLAPGN
ncbi:MAG TPA: OmpA family protein [Saprospiraceae bacterium]|nr:OmpA family protein [Saprospiraceae bacterium]